MSPLTDDFRLEFRESLGQVVVEGLRFRELVESPKILLLLLQFFRCLDKKKAAIPDIGRVEPLL
jgi:hypothetical protein